MYGPIESGVPESVQQEQLWLWCLDLQSLHGSYAPVFGQELG